MSMSDLREYKCPACGGAIEFDSKSQKMKCPYCDTEFELETLKELDAQMEREAGQQDDLSAGSRTGLPRRRTGQPDTGHRPPSKETEETIRDPDHSPEHHLQRHPFQIRNGQGNHSASEWKKNLRIKLA